ncbi:hypothetical protein CLAIMM_05796 [Cladophialophora immunda]|nr:hypothetical protein CLAIMM_05796 [Cladophialophora immunda]
MEGYDTTLINGFYAFRAFRAAYGSAVHGPDSATTVTYQINPRWQAALTNSGEIVGLFLNGLWTDRFGHRWTMIGTLILMLLFVFPAFFAVNIEMILLLGVAVMRGLVNNASQWSYRIPFGLQWLFAAVILSGVIFAPESPWWLVRHGKLRQAKRSLLRLVTMRLNGFTVDGILAMMKQTNDIGKLSPRRDRLHPGLFQGDQPPPNGDLLHGLLRTGDERFNTNWWEFVSFCILVSAGIVGTLRPSTSTSWATASLLILLTFVYDMTLGPVCYVLVAEVPSTCLRVKSVVLARAAYNAISIAMNNGTSHMLNPAALNSRGKTCFFYAVTTALSFAWCYIRLPEPKGPTYLELDILCEKKARATRFKEFQAVLESSGYFSLARGGSFENSWRGY